HPYSISVSFFFFSLLPPPPRSTLFPYTTLFRSSSTTRMRALRLVECGVASCMACIENLYGFRPSVGGCVARLLAEPSMLAMASRDRKSTRLNSSHSQISYAVFCLKKKKKNKKYY